MLRFTWLFACLAIALSMIFSNPFTSAHSHEDGSDTAHDYPIQPVPFTQVKLTGGMWLDRLKTNHDVTVWYDLQKCEETKRIDNFAIAGGLKEGGFTGLRFNDSDVVKVLEGASYIIAQGPNPKLEAKLDEIIAKIAAAQEDDGYLYTPRTINDPNYKYAGMEARWSNLAVGHELYNVGHMYEAAVAHYQATGKRTFLDVAIKNADLVCKTFGAGEGQIIGVPGHQEIEIGLAKLYRVTGDEKYLKQAKFFTDMRGRADLREKLFGEYSQDHILVVNQDEAVGHAVRAAYLYSGMADIAALTGDKAYIDATQKIWENIVSKKMYLTGGIGSLHKGEAFGKNYELPNASAYNETCAAIAHCMFNHRMFMLHGDAKYIDVLERILYNGFISGVSLQGDEFFYANPLAWDGKRAFNIDNNTGRAPWFNCSCCPVNVVRYIPSVPGLVYAVRDDQVYVNLFTTNEAQMTVDDMPIAIVQKTDYPWDGKVKITIKPEQEKTFALMVRIPGWARNEPVPSDLYRFVNRDDSQWKLKINGKRVKDATLVDGYIKLDREWKSGDKLELELPMPVRLVKANEAVEADRGRIAVQRGPIVYCFEAVDNDGDVADLVLDDSANLKAKYHKDLLHGLTVITGKAKRAVRKDDGTVELKTAKVTAIPYYAWHHREPGPMQVWVASDISVAQLPAVPTIASKSKPSASHCWRSNTIDAINDQVEPFKSNDHEIARHTFWDHKGTDEWLQYDFAEPAEVSKVKLYWFDDTGRGSCRVPESWRLLYRDGKTWKPVVTKETFSVDVDRFNAVNFDAVTTDALRIEVKLQQDKSAGVLEWVVE